MYKRRMGRTVLVLAVAALAMLVAREALAAAILMAASGLIDAIAFKEQSK